MILCYEPLALDVRNEKGKITGICIENPIAFREFIDLILRQSDGEDGGIVISNKEKAVRWGKDISVVINPFALDINEKKILNSIYSELESIGKQEYYTEISKVNTDIVSLLECLNNRVPYPLDFELDIDIQQLLKCYKVQVDDESEKLHERIANYIKMASQVLNTKYFCFVNLKQYLDETELEYLYESALYEDVHVIMIESNMKRRLLQEKWWIVDSDKCVIEI